MIDLEPHPCATDLPGDFDHEWRYEPNDPECGITAHWYCEKCGETDYDRAPDDDPSDSV